MRTVLNRLRLSITPQRVLSVIFLVVLAYLVIVPLFLMLRETFIVHPLERFQIPGSRVGRHHVGPLAAHVRRRERLRLLLQAAPEHAPDLVRAVVPRPRHRRDAGLAGRAHRPALEGRDLERRDHPLRDAVLDLGARLDHAVQEPAHRRRPGHLHRPHRHLDARLVRVRALPHHDHAGAPLLPVRLHADRRGAAQHRRPARGVRRAAGRLARDRAPARGDPARAAGDLLDLPAHLLARPRHLRDARLPRRSRARVRALDDALRQPDRAAPGHRLPRGLRDDPRWACWCCTWTTRSSARAAASSPSRARAPAPAWSRWGAGAGRSRWP